MKHSHTFELSVNAKTKKFDLEQRKLNITLSKMIVYTKEGMIDTNSIEFVKKLSLEISTCNSSTSLKDVSSIPMTNLIKGHNNGEYILNFDLVNRDAFSKRNQKCNYLTLSIPELDQFPERVIEFKCSIERISHTSKESTLENNAI